jgi:hypothetical protein
MRRINAAEGRLYDNDYSGSRNAHPGVAYLQFTTLKDLYPDNMHKIQLRALAQRSVLRWCMCKAKLLFFLLAPAHRRMESPWTFRVPTSPETSHIHKLFTRDCFFVPRCSSVDITEGAELSGPGTGGCIFDWQSCEIHRGLRTSVETRLC